MRRIVVSWVVAGCLLSTSAAWAEEGKVCKVLPQFVDERGRSSLAPSLYERDAYQFYLRRHPGQRKGLRLAIQWKAKGADWHQLKLRAELRGLASNTMKTVTLEGPVTKGNFFGHWTDLNLTGQPFKDFGELVAWRVTILDGDKPLGQLESFLWSGVTAQ